MLFESSSMSFETITLETRKSMKELKDLQSDFRDTIRFSLASSLGSNLRDHLWLSLAARLRNNLDSNLRSILWSSLNLSMRLFEAIDTDLDL